LEDQIEKWSSRVQNAPFQACIVSFLLPWTLKACLQRRNGNGETPTSQSNQNSICKAYLCEDYNPGEIRIKFSRPHAYRKESNRGGIVGASIRLKHNVPMPYHDSGRISSMTAYKRRGITRTRGEEDTEKKEQKTGEQKTQKKKENP
jgi:hypothetical protein